MSYQVHNFQPGDVLLAEQLNEMDNQIAENNTSKQATITASGILKGDGDGTVDTAVAGTDYATPSAIQVSVVTNANTTLTLSPCPVTYKWSEVATLTLTVTATSQFHFMFTCPSGSPTVLTLNGITGVSGDTTLEAGATYEVDVWGGIALYRKVGVTVVT